MSTFFKYLNSKHCLVARDDKIDNGLEPAFFKRALNSDLTIGPVICFS